MILIHFLLVARMAVCRAHFLTFLSIHISKHSYPFTFPNNPIHSHFQTFLSIHISKHSYPFTFPNIPIHSHFQTFLSIHISKQSYPFTFPNNPIHSHFQTFLSIHISKHSYPFTFPNILIHSHVFRQVLPDVLILRNEGCGTYQEQWQGLCDAQCMAAQQNLPCRDAHRVLQLQTNPNVECWLSVRCVE